MKRFLFVHRHAESLREQRLIFQQMKSSEAEPKLHALLQENAAMEELEGAVEEADSNHTAFDAFVNNKNLDERKRRIIEKNIRRVAEHADERVGAKAKATSMVEHIRKVFGPSKTSAETTPAKQEAPVPTPEEKNVMERSWEKTKAWVKEHPNASVAIGSTLGVGLVYGLWRWMRGGKKEEGEKKEGEKTEQKSGKWKWLLWVPVVGLVGLGLYKGNQYLTQNVEWYKKRMTELEKLAGKGKDVVVATGKVAAGAGGVVTGAGKEAAELGVRAGGVALSGAEVAKDTFDLIHEYFRGGNTEKAIEELQKSGGALVERGGDFFCWWGGKLVLLPKEYAAQLVRCVTQRDNFWDFGVVAGELGTLYVFNAGVARLLLTGSAGKFGWHTIGRVVGAPCLMMRDGSVVAYSVTRDRPALMAKLRGALGQRYFKERSAVGFAERFARSSNVADLERALSQWKAFSHDISIAEMRTAERSWGLRFDEGYVQSIKVKRENVANAIRKSMEKMKAPPQDAPSWVRKVWEARMDSPHKFDDALGSALRGEGAVAKTASETVVIDSEAPKTVEQPAKKSTNTSSKGTGEKPKASTEASPTKKPTALSEGPQTKPVQTKSTGTAQVERSAVGGADRARSTPPKPSSAHESLPAGVQKRAGKVLGGLEADIARAAERSEGSRVLRSSARAREILSATPLDPKLAKLVDDSPEFAKVLVRHLESSPQATRIVSELNGAMKATDDTSFVTKILSTEKSCSKVIAGIEAGKPAAKALAQASRVSRVAQTLKFAGKTVPVAFDAFAAYASVLEILETSAELERLRGAANPNQKLINLTEQKYLYQGTQFAVSGAGVAAGGCLLFGVGTTIASPVLIVTLPVSAVIGGAYAAHNWDVKMAHTVEDWRNTPLQQRFADLRSYSFEERAGHVTKDILASMAESEASLGRRSDDKTNYVEIELERQDKDMRQLAETQILSIIKDTTTVGVPAKVMDQDGTVRDPNPEEIKQYVAEVERYVDARLKFFLSQRKDATHAVRGGDIVDLIENSEYAGQLAKDRPALESELKTLSGRSDPASQNRAREIHAVLEEKDPVQQAKLYKTFAQREQIQNQHSMLLLKSAALQKDYPKQARNLVQTEIYRLLNERAQPALINFYTRCEEDNLVEWGTDGLASHIVKAYAEEQVEDLVKKNAAPVVDMILAGGDAAGMQGSVELQKTATQFQLDVERFLASPSAVWQNMPKTKEYKLLPEQQKFTEKQRGIIQKGESLMQRINANYNGSYYTKQFGWMGNQFLYVRFDIAKNKWLVGLWSKEEAVNDPSRYSVNMWGGSEKYNALIRDLAAINEGHEPSQSE